MVEFGAESPDFEPRGTSHPDPEGPNRPNRGSGNAPFDPRIGLAGRVASITDHQNAGTCSRKSPKTGFPGAPKRRNFFAEVAISSSGNPRKTWISRYIETAERICETRDFELRETGQKLDFEVHQNRGIRWWRGANSGSGGSPKIRHFPTIKRRILAREAPISGSAEPAIPARKAPIGRTGASITGHSIRG